MADIQEIIPLVSRHRKVGRFGSLVALILTMLPILPAGQSGYPAAWAGDSSNVDAQCSQGIGKAIQPWMDKLITFHQGNQ